MNFFWYDWAGYIGVVLVLSAFLLLQAHKLHGNSLIYQLMNVLGAIGVIISLSFSEGQINWPAFLMQLAWITIGVYGIVRAAQLRRAARDANRHVGP
jgi:paired small multidrug resistance pump